MPSSYDHWWLNSCSLTSLQHKGLCLLAWQHLATPGQDTNVDDVSYGYKLVGSPQRRIVLHQVDCYLGSAWMTPCVRIQCVDVTTVRRVSMTSQHKCYVMLRVSQNLASMPVCSAFERRLEIEAALMAITYSFTYLWLLCSRCHLSDGQWPGLVAMRAAWFD